MTIPFLEVSLGRIFECGQAYVALSRATSLEGLILKHFKASCIRAHSQVKQFYQAIKSSQTSSNSDVDTCEVNLKQFAEIFVKEGLEQAPVDEDAWLDAKPKDAIIKRSQTLPPSQPTRNAFAPPPSRVVTPQEVKKVSHPQIIDVDAMEVVTPKQNESVVSSNVPKVPIFSSARTMIVTPTTASSQQPSAIDSNNSKPSEATISDELRK